MGFGEPKNSVEITILPIIKKSEITSLSLSFRCPVISAAVRYTCTVGSSVIFCASKLQAGVQHPFFACICNTPSSIFASPNLFAIS